MAYNTYTMHSKRRRALAYASVNFKTKKELREAIKRGDKIRVYEPGLGDAGEIRDGIISIEGPYAPAAHTWYADAHMSNCFIIKIT